MSSPEVLDVVVVQRSLQTSGLTTAVHGCLWLCFGHSYEAFLGCYISGVGCLLSAGYLLTEGRGGGGEPLVQAGDNACQLQ